MPPRAEIVVDLAAIRHNVRRLREIVGPGVAMMTVVKADGYGHGMVAVARADREAGADWLGVATLDEALVLRDAGDTGRILCWLTVPGEDYAAAAMQVPGAGRATAAVDGPDRSGRHQHDGRARRPARFYPVVMADQHAWNHGSIASTRVSCTQVSQW